MLNRNYKKQQKIFNCNRVKSNLDTIYKKTKNICYIKSTTFGRLTVFQIKSFKQILLKKLKRKGRVIFNLNPNIPVTKKPIETRMGKGKGNVNYYVCKVKPGVTLCYIETMFRCNIQRFLNQIQIRLPIKIKIWSTSTI